MKFKKKFNNENKIKTRKELRKEKRQEKKQKKNEYFRNRKQNKTKQDVIQNKTDKRIQQRSNQNGPKEDFEQSKDLEELATAESLLEKQRVRERQIQNSIQSNSKAVRNKQLINANKDEDKEIKRLEKLLNLNKRKSKKIPSSFVSDGLDYLLEICDSEKRKEISEFESQQRLSDSESDFEEDLAQVTGKVQKKKKKLNANKDKPKAKKKQNNKDDDLEVDESDNDEFSGDSSENSGSEDEIDDFQDDSVDEDDFDDEFDDDDFDEEFDDEGTGGTNSDSEPENETQDENDRKRKHVETLNKNTNEIKKKVKFDVDVKGTSSVKDDNEGKPLSKEERMKRLMGFVEKESNKNEKQTKGNDKEKSLSKEDRMKQLLGFVNDEKADDGEEGDIDENEVEEDANERRDGTWEDIYGRKRDKDGNVIQTNASKYIPPHLRNTGSSTDKESLALLKRQLKGLLNRLTENNIKSISSGIETIYSENSRHDTNSTLLTLMRESLLSETLTPEKMMIEHAMLITILHANIGTEIGASLLQSLVQDWDTLYKTPACHCVENKRLDNYVALLIPLYQFKLLTHTLVYDLLDLLIASFDEKCIELILALLKTIGLSLRKDNAVRFKASLLAVQSQSNACNPDLRDKPRTKFMLDILLAVKNNNVHKIPGYDVSAVQRMKAALKFLIRPSCYVSELNMGLQDLLKADEKGRWWIVGSAWTGNLEDASSKPTAGVQSDHSSQFSAEILELARKQRMNTAVRRNVFCVLMSSEDYLDAYEKLLKLGVKQDQTDNIVNVIVHCLLNEKQYNPYYTHLTSHFISSNRRYRMLVQYTVWDKFKLLKDMKPTQIVNLAKFLSALFVQQALPVSVLKVIEFTELQKHHVRLVRQIFLALLLLRDEDSLRAVFGKITKSPELKLLREGLHLFLITFVTNKLGTEDAGSESDRVKKNAALVGELLAPR